MGDIMQNTQKELIEQIKKELEEWNEKKASYYECTKKEMKKFLADIKKGNYQKMLQETYYYSLSSLIAWHKIRQQRQQRSVPISAITRENYEVFKEIRKILIHIRNLIDNNTYTLRYQTPPTEEELQRVLSTYQNVLITNYTFSEVEEIKKRVEKLRIYDNQKFPHNTKEIEEAFFPQIIKISPKYEGSPIVKETQSTKKIAHKLKEKITNGRIQEIFTSFPKSKEESYVRRMILSQIDVPAAVYENYNFFFQQAIDMIREALTKGVVLDQEQQRLLWKNIYTDKRILPLITGVLDSLKIESTPVNIEDELKKTQKENHCSANIVTKPYQNQLYLGQMKMIYSMNPENIPYFLQGLQNKYNELYEVGTDYEFVEGCIEIMGDLMISQIFLEGNKRTAKCMFNKMLISRGILPPVVDLNEDELSLWDSFVESRNLNYKTAKEIILDKTKEMATQFSEGYYENPVIVSSSAISRPDFCDKYYRR